MNKLFFRCAFLLISVTFVENSNANEIERLVLKTVNNNNKPIKAEFIRWWASGNPKKQKTLKCQQTNCAEWSIVINKSAPLSIYAFASIVRKNDPYCWDWYEGTIENQTTKKEIILMLSYTSTVCK